VSNGAHAHGLLQAQCQRLVELHAPVLRDQDPEPLHQMRVSLRRLSTTLVQFAPCLALPKGLSEKQLAKTVRQLGMARDLDVLQERLDDGLLPQLPEQERQRLKPARRQLARERRAAMASSATSCRAVVI
jgi:CHAD domain-containing protein